MDSGTLRLASIHIYPLKGAGGWALDSAEPDAFGLPGDRRWMLVRPDGMFISQRSHPRLALLRVEPAHPPGTFRVAAEGHGGIVLSRGTPADGLMDVQLHQDRLQGRVPPEAGRWFSEFLGEEVHLVFIPYEINRAVDPAYAPGHRTGFSDGYPLLITTSASLKALNGGLETPVGMDRFRPNLVIDGADPWEEDRWRTLEVGAARFHLVKPCARCSVTLVDQATAEKGLEPLRTLSVRRGWEGKSYFGQNAVFGKNGSFRVGQSVRIVEEGDARPPLPDPPPPGG